MLVKEFDYELPAELIAQKPLARRDQSRMMVLDRQTGNIVHSRFVELPAFLNKGDVLVINTTKVIPAKVWGKKHEKEIDFLFLDEVEEGVWKVLCRPARNVKTGDVITFSQGLKGTVIRSEEEGKRVIQFQTADVIGELELIGYAPLPPYIKRKKRDKSLKALDLERYQTAFAKEGKAIAAPTAGLHFTLNILELIRAKGVEVCPLSLEVGHATFQPVRADRVEDHKMLRETYILSQSTISAINRAKDESRQVTAVGTTSVRALESAYQQDQVKPGVSSTDLFIYPGFEFRIIDSLLTNFHLPRSTLLMLVAAFTGLDLIKKTYREAVREKYRFYSYGDCMLII